MKLVGARQPWSDRTVAVELTRFVIPNGGDPLSLLCRLAASVPPPKR